MAAHDIESVEVDRSSHVLVEFADGVTARFPLPALRLACPCADCNAKRRTGQPVTALGPDDVGSITVREASMAGAWGLDLDWSDGHSTGIYAFETLREWADHELAGVEVTRPD